MHCLHHYNFLPMMTIEFMETMTTEKLDRSDQPAGTSAVKVDPEELAKFGCTPEGNRRALSITIFYLLFALLLAIPLWFHTTATYQAPLPYADIRELCSKPVTIAVRFNVINFQAALELPHSESVKKVLPSACERVLRQLQTSEHQRLKVTCSLGQGRQATVEEQRIASSALERSPRDFEELIGQLTGLEDRLINTWTSDGSDGGSRNCPSVYPDCHRLLAFTVWLLPLPPSSPMFSPRRSQHLSEIPGRNLFHLLNPRDQPLGGANELASALADLMATRVLPVRDLMLLSGASSFPDGNSLQSLGREKTRDFFTTVSRELPPSAVYDITVTLLNRRPGRSSKGKIAPTNWIKELQEDPSLWLNRYVEKAFQSWLPFVRLEFRSQNLHAVYPEKLVSPRFDASDRQYYTRDDLSTTVNLLESYLGAAQSASVATRDLAGTNPGLHIILILDQGSGPEGCSRSTLRFRLPEEADVALVPQWGGLFTVDTPCPRQVNGTLDGVRRAGDDRQGKAVLGAKVVAVIRSLLGVVSEATQPGTSFRPVRSLTRAEMDSWYARRLVQNLLNVKATFTSLVELLHRFPNMMVRDNVASDVAQAVHSWRRILQQLSTNAEAGSVPVNRVDNASSPWQPSSPDAYLSLASVFADSQETLDSINSAFYDHTLLERLSFADDQKLGIYVPLFLPISVTFIKSLYVNLRKYL